MELISAWGLVALVALWAAFMLGYLFGYRRASKEWKLWSTVSDAISNPLGKEAR